MTRKVEAAIAERSIVVSGLPVDSSETEVVIHFQRRKNGGGDVENVLWDENDGTAVVIFADIEDATSVLKTKQYFRDTFELTVGPAPVENKEMPVFQSVSGLLHPNLFVGLSQDDVKSIVEKVNESASVQWLPSDVGLMSSGTIKQLEIARDILEREVKLARKRGDSFTTSDKVLPFRDGGSTPATKCCGTSPKSEGELGAVGCTKYQKNRRKLENNKAIRKPRPGQPRVKPDFRRNSPRQNYRGTIDDRHESSKVENTEYPTSSQDMFTCGNTEPMKNFDRNFHPFSQNSLRRQKPGRGKNFKESGNVFGKTKHYGFAPVTNFPNKVSVSMMKGGITNDTHANVIVNPCNNNLQNTSGVGALIIDSGGLSIQNELNVNLADRDTFPPGKIIVTSAGSLPVNSIFHVVCPQWDHDNEDKCSKVLNAVCIKSLDKFSETEMTTIAYPSFSSPWCPVPEASCARIMLNAVAVFAEKRNHTQSTKPMNVHFVFDKDDTLSIYNAELNKLLNARQFSKAPGQARTRDEVKPARRQERKKYAETTGDTTNQCPVCLDEMHQPTTLEKCQHTFCKVCLDSAFQIKKICPLCKVSYGVVTGTQPDGTMSFTKEPSSLPGYPEYGTIVITYHFKGGYQGARHPSPGERYSGTTRTAYLPDNREGNEVLSMLQKAFDDRLIFKIGTSLTTSMSNQITWSDIHHKTSKHGGQHSFGYPDPEYLMRVKEQLAAKGIYP